jgi:uncharacterized protein (DUF1499 family)
MHIRVDLLPWEQLFIGSALGLCTLVIACGMALVRRRSIGRGRWLCLALFAVGVILPWLSQPRFAARLQRGMQTNITDTAADSDWPELRPRRYAEPGTVVAEAAAHTVIQLGWRLVTQDSTSLTAEVPILFGVLTDDLRVRLSTEQNQTVVNVRSTSRVGRADFGANRRHVLQFFTVLDQQLKLSPP